MRLERYVTLKRNCKNVQTLDATGITLNDVQELLRMTESMKILLRNIATDTDNDILAKNIQSLVNELFNSQQIHLK
jgi:hypothetical protein